ncbi:adenosylmethionine-8-amino-7-oxononanoate aminotransferase [Klebsiella pneumoniae]|uniref:Adenosylmethionine-8-amino-7-oxononanoate aminotransferase n=1 Tax=Klebsiella pneumoniae TaxID=573 RepID=A0A447S3U6_KLEPN|nr:adenosylmethionine-8-amino-7-oxononanoate aminotransferase [Klebsiella pneumoniae]
MSVCDPQNSMHSLWQGYLPDNLFAPAPQSRFDGEWDEMGYGAVCPPDGRASS